MSYTKAIPGVLSYELKAQTPMIHFQHDQSGATLRATEVKPKLDKFLISRCESVPQSWYIGTTNALNYKMHILGARNFKVLGADCPNDKKKKEKEQEYKFFFGNMGDGAQKKRFIVRDATLTIICNNPDLRELIDKNIKHFFILTNFGMRQSKGFGSFIVEDTKTCDIEAALKASNTIKFRFNYPANSNGKDPWDTKPFAMAHAVYSVMKSGINNARFTPMVGDKCSPEFNPAEGWYANKGSYVKGFSLREFLEPTVGSDKAFIKSRVLPVLSKRINPRPDPGENSKAYEQYVFIRALLGLAGYFEYNDDLRCPLNERMTDIKKRAIYYRKKACVFNFNGAYIDEAGKYKVDPNEIERDSGIKRFKSPVTIKIFNGQVVFMLNNTYEELLDKLFVFLGPENPKLGKTYADAIEDKEYATAAQILSRQQWMKTPKSFDGKDFVERFISYFNNEVTRLKNLFRDNPYKNPLVDFSATPRQIFLEEVE